MEQGLLSEVRVKKTLPPAVSAIIRRVAEEHGVTASQILSDNLRRKVSHARHAAIYAVRSEIKIAGDPPSLNRLGMWFGRHHTSVMYGASDHKIRSGGATKKRTVVRMKQKAVKACRELRRYHENAAREKERTASLERRLAWSRDVPRVPLVTKGRAAA